MLNYAEIQKNSLACIARGIAKPPAPPVEKPPVNRDKYQADWQTAQRERFAAQGLTTKGTIPKRKPKSITTIPTKRASPHASDGAAAIQTSKTEKGAENAPDAANRVIGANS